MNTPITVSQMNKSNTHTQTERSRESDWYLDNFKNGLGDKCSSPLSIMASGDNPIKKLPTFTKLHHKINSLSVLINLSVPHNVRVFRQMPHDLHLPPHILDIYLRPELALRYLLTRQALAIRVVKTLVRHAEFPSSELLPESVLFENVVARWVGEHLDRTGEAQRRQSAAEFDNIVGFLVVVLGLLEEG